jgi:hypothetical protein
MIPIEYQVVGEEEYALRIQVTDDGHYTVESGTYTTYEPRTGAVPDDIGSALARAVEQLGTPSPHPMPEGATAFRASLSIGLPGDQVRHEFWEGELETNTDLNRLVRLLERL